MSKKFPATFEVCTCKHVTLGELVYAIKEKNAKTIQDLGKFTDAGTLCKSCITKENDIRASKKNLYLNQIIKKFIKE